MDWWVVPIVIAGSVLSACIVIGFSGLLNKDLLARTKKENRCPARKDFARCSREKDHRGAHEAHGERARDDIVWSGGKQCQVCQGKDFVVVAEGGGGENVRCEKCGSLYTWGPFGLELIQAGQPAPKVVLPDGQEALICNSNQEAFDVAKAWNRTHDVNPGAYVVDDGGVVATDGRDPIRVGVDGMAKLKRWWLRPSKSRMCMHRNEQCARRSLSAAMPPPKAIDDWDDDDVLLYIICGTCARSDRDRLRLLADRLFS